jgi:hypothetical protein
MIETHLDALEILQQRLLVDIQYQIPEATADNRDSQDSEHPIINLRDTDSDGSSDLEVE